MASCLAYFCSLVMEESLGFISLSDNNIKAEQRNITLANAPEPYNATASIFRKGRSSIKTLHAQSNETARDDAGGANHNRIPSTTNEVHASADSDYEDHFAFLRQQAQAALDHIQANGDFDTAMTTYSSIVGNPRVFPQPWNPCVLPRALQQQLTLNKDNFQIVLVGGSPSSVSAAKCTTPDDDYSGRWSNMLETQLNNRSSSSRLQFQVSNMAQGNTDSAVNAIMLDQLIDPYRTDLIVHEFGINDQANSSPEMQALQLDIWMGSLHALYAPHNRKPPPILLLYLWEYQAAKHPDRIRQQGLEAATFSNQQKVTEYYRTQLKWDIAVVNVAGGVNHTIVADDTKTLMDDNHHPSCVGMHLISAIVQQAIWSSLTLVTVNHHNDTNANATATANSNSSGYCPEQPDENAPLNSNTTTHPHMHNPVPQGNRRYHDMFQALYQEGTRLGSLTAWEPTANTSTAPPNKWNLTVTTSNGTKPKLVLTARASHNRQDRKVAFVVPPCQEGSLNISIPETYDVEWLGISYERGKGGIAGNSNPEARINGVVMAEAQRSRPPVGRFTAVWHLPSLALNANATTATQYTTLALCSRDEVHGFLQYLTGVFRDVSLKTEADVDPPPQVSMD